jgi:8-oxo-dGTP pyrophosphatase MutT (NUDIX family)
MSLLSLLAAHRPLDEREASDLERMRFLVSELTHPFSRTQWPAHFTGSALILDSQEKRVCLLFHKKLQRWLQPGGHSDDGDEGRMAATALREAREETGLSVELHHAAPQPFDVDIHTIPARKDEPTHQHLDVRFLMRAPEAALTLNAEESETLRWFTFDEALALMDEAPMQRMLTKAQRLVSSQGKGNRNVKQV